MTCAPIFNHNFAVTTTTKFIFVSILSTLGLAWAVWFAGIPAFYAFQEQRASSQASSFFAAGDLRGASLAARRALHFSPSNVVSLGIMTQISEKARPDQVLEWRRRLAEASGAPDHRLAYAAAALRSVPPQGALANEVLAQFTGLETNTVPYALLKAEASLQQHHAETAEHFLSFALRLAPTNDLVQLNLLALQLRSGDEAKKLAAKAGLQALIGNPRPEIGCAAARWLISESLQRKDFSSAIRFSAQLRSQPGATFHDTLSHLTLLQNAASAELYLAVQDAETIASTNPSAIHAMGGWFLATGRVQECGTWLESLPDEMKQRMPAPLAFVDLYAAKKDWLGIENFLQSENWGDTDFLRLACLSRSAWELDEKRLAETRWRGAVREANGRPAAQRKLAELAKLWGKSPELEELLWSIANQYGGEQWAFLELEQLYARKQDTPALHKLYGRMSALNPLDLTLSNNVVATALLLRIRTNTTHKAAEALYQQRATDPVIASTRAFSLLLQGQVRRALEILSALDPKALAKPQVALYYGLALHAAGEKDKASKFLSIAASQPMLPEERSLLTGL